ncbi:MAG TPA: D-2-hydroxyacid dehydrogenase family protein [Candidatus Binatia bacterium]|nr:D-2-hydroxyacid dehydrogenase family protein [Candidatus Binatia bacterium]
MSAQRPRVAVLDDFELIADSVPAYERLKARCDVSIVRERLDTSEKIVARLRTYDVLLLMRERTRFSEQEYRQLPNLRFIAQTGKTSVHLDLAAATRAGIAVAGTPSDTGTTTKELTIGLILALLRKIPQINQRMREELWPAITGRMLQGKTAGVFGFGRIGMEVARILTVFNTRVLAYSRSLTQEKAAEAGAECVSREVLFQESDIITVHIPLNANTRGAIGAREFALMRPGALLVNTARGPIVSEPAMIEALQSGRLGGVGLDVYDVEPLPLDHPLRRFDNAILMSHRGYATQEILSERYEQAMENILKFIDGKPLNLLNPDVKIGE